MKDQSLLAATNISEQESLEDIALRPSQLEHFIGQTQLKEVLKVFISAAKTRKEAIDHIILHGPPGLGKTTLARIVAKELEVDIKTTSGPMISKVGDLAAILTNLQPGDVLFIDEIHRLPSSVEETLYSAMEDYALDIILGTGPAARTVRIELPKFTLIGATTRLGLLTAPLRDRFGIPLNLDFYDLSELKHIILRNAKLLNLIIEEEAALLLASASRGTPRIAGRLLRRMRDFAHYNKQSKADISLVVEALKALKIDSQGLDNSDRKYINFIANSYQGGPVGIDTIAAALSEEKDTIEESIEPYLIKIGFVNKTPRGRTLTIPCLDYWNKLNAS